MLNHKTAACFLFRNLVNLRAGSPEEKWVWGRGMVRRRGRGECGKLQEGDFINILKCQAEDKIRFPPILKFIKNVKSEKTLQRIPIR